MEFQGRLQQPMKLTNAKKQKYEEENNYVFLDFIFLIQHQYFESLHHP